MDRIILSTCFRGPGVVCVRLVVVALFRFGFWDSGNRAFLWQDREKRGKDRKGKTAPI